MDRLATARRLFLIQVERRAIRIGAHSGRRGCKWSVSVSLSPVESRHLSADLSSSVDWTYSLPFRGLVYSFVTGASANSAYSLHYTEHCTSYSRHVKVKVK